MVVDARAQALAVWVKSALVEMPELGAWQADPVMISGDASFRRYFRLHTSHQSLIAVDAPNNTENNPGFVAIAHGLAAQGVRVPTVYAWCESQGFMLLSDLGDALLLPALNANTADALYAAALAELLPLQQCITSEKYLLPHYDGAKLLTEMRLLTEWFIPRYLGVELSAEQAAALAQQFDALVVAVAKQPEVFVHRDYHSRNLMLLPDNAVGVIDFQDGVIGPITYDLVSLTRDAYISWPDADRQRWELSFLDRLQQVGRVAARVTSPQFLRWCDDMAAQRHLKVLGIFARLYLRDNKPRYLQDMPLVYRYLLDETRDHPDYAALHGIMRELLPAFLRVNPEGRARLESYL